MDFRIEGLIGEDVTAGRVADLLDRDAGPVEIVVNSPGGSATEGAAIYAELRAHPAPVTIRVRGIAASAASLIACAGDRITMAPGAIFMLHDPAAITLGDADAHRQAVAMLDELSRVYAQVYADASGNPEPMVRDWMRAESWLGPEEAVALGFADALEEPPAPDTTARGAPAALAHHRPAAFVAQPVLTL